MHYTVAQWILFFFIYAFAGWIWESCYASFGQKRLVNRGFLHGPIIPIYGFGALSVLVFTIGVRGSTISVFVFGMIGATLLEYVTGWGMERLFHVKYWDYSSFPFNLNGYICLLASLAWGVFSVLMVRVIQPPIEDAVLALNRNVTEIGAALFAMVAGGDALQSAKEAMDLRDLLERLEDSKKQIEILEKRLEINAVFRMDGYKKRIRHAEKSLNPFALRRHFMSNMRELRSFRAQQLREFLSKAEERMASDRAARADAMRLRETILSELQKLGARRDRQYRNVIRILNRNPRAKSKDYQAALDEIHSLMD